MSDVVRAHGAGPDEPNTYTRTPMETGTAGISRDVPAADTSESETGIQMALLAAHEQERQRLAEELHDGTAQGLTNAIFQADIVAHAVREDPAQASVEVKALREMLERELDTLRGYINQLRPSLGEAAGLDEALSDSAGALNARTGLPVDITLEAPDDCRFKVFGRPLLTGVTTQGITVLPAPVAFVGVHVVRVSVPDVTPAWRSEHTLGYRPPPYRLLGPSRAPPQA